MTPDRWAQIEELFHRTVQCDPQQQAALLDEACDGDKELRREVEVLLASKERASDRMQAAVQGGLDGLGFPLVGETVSHYHILDGLGGGGMGLVYRAEDIKLGRQVALKFLPEESAKEPAALARFEREARSASALEHPNICPIYEFGEHEGQPFLVMQSLEGQTLRELISAAGPGKPPFPVDAFLDYAIQIASGLEAAHGHGIIHRDIKPANIFVTTQGPAKILDFGLAKLSRWEIAEDESGRTASNLTASQQTPNGSLALATPDPLLSRTGVAMGTAGYMSPEQARGERLDARTDLFSFGLVLYEMATGQRAFKGDTGPLLHHAILRSKPASARELNPQVPAKLESILHKALEKDRAVRYQSAVELRRDLQSLKRKVESKHSLRRWVPASAIFVLMIVGGIFWSVRRQPQALPQIKLRQLTINSSENKVKFGAISPNGKYLAFVDSQGIHVKDVERGTTQSLAKPEALKNVNVNWEILNTSWFPDSERFFVNAHPGGENQSVWASPTTSIWVYSTSGEPPYKLRDKATAWSVSPDGSQVSFGTNKGKLGDREIWLTGPRGEQTHKLYDAGENHAICCLYFLSDVGQVSYISTDESGDSLVARRFPDGALSTLLKPSELGKLGDAAWLPGGRMIYSENCSFLAYDTPCNYWTMRFDTSSWRLIEKPRRLTDWVGFSMKMPSVTSDGKRLAFRRSPPVYPTAYVADLSIDGTRISNLRHFTLEESDAAIAGWTFDSKAVFIVKGHADHYEIYRGALDTETEEVLMTSGGGGDIIGLNVSADGKWLIIHVFPLPGGSFAPHPLMRVPITGGSPELIFTTPRWSSFNCAMPPSNLCAVVERTADSKQMVVTAFDPVKGRGPELTRYDVDFFPEEDGIPMFGVSPDGTRLAFAGKRNGPIQILTLRGGHVQFIRAKVLNNMRLLGWTSDGKGLLVSNTIEQGGQLFHVDLNGNTTVLWTWNEGGDRCDAATSPDGRHIALDGWKQNANMWLMENF